MSKAYRTEGEMEIELDQEGAEIAQSIFGLCNVRLYWFHGDHYMIRFTEGGLSGDHRCYLSSDGESMGVSMRPAEGLSPLDIAGPLARLAWLAPLALVHGGAVWHACRWAEAFVEQDAAALTDEIRAQRYGKRYEVPLGPGA